MDDSIRELIEIAEQGEAETQYKLGWKYLHGNGVAQSDPEAAKWLRKAAEQGFARAQSILGVMYFVGRGVPQSDTEAVKWCQLAEEQGNAVAQYTLGWMYRQGRGVPQSDTEAVKWFQLAAEQGNADAQKNLGVMYAEGRGVPQSNTEAVKWFQLAAEQGNAGAQYNLGVMYANGLGIPKDDTEAVKWYQKAAEQGDATAQYNLGVMYANGRGVPQDDGEAVKWYRKAAEQGHARAQNNLVAALRAEMERMRAEMARLADLAAGRKAEGAAPAPAPPVEAWRKAGETTTITLPGGATMEMAWCPPGSFMMGSPSGLFTREYSARSKDELQHRVTLTEGFWMAKTPVTQRQWKSVMGNNPSEFKGDDLPVETVSWEDAQEFCRKAGLGLALPTEAQWEYACRAGTTGPYAGTGRLKDMGWYLDNSGRRTHPVGTKKPNAWGLFDMHGNVCEWCADWDRVFDWYSVYPDGAVTDPKGDSDGSYRVVRGGSWSNDAAYCRSAYRRSYDPSYTHGNLGFRPARILS